MSAAMVRNCCTVFLPLFRRGKLPGVLALLQKLFYNENASKSYPGGLISLGLFNTACTIFKRI